jgi:hypothetical protein
LTASPGALADAAAERAAIVEVEGGTDPLRWGLREHMAQSARLRGLQAAANMRPPSWMGTPPSSGCWCGCCRTSRWWTERAAPGGWRCWACHPPVHLPAAAVQEVST